jgi:hypothetical protein
MILLWSPKVTQHHVKAVACSQRTRGCFARQASPVITVGAGLRTPPVDGFRPAPGISSYKLGGFSRRRRGRWKSKRHAFGVDDIGPILRGGKIVFQIVFFVWVTFRERKGASFA